MKPVKILSIDGGGIYGIFSAVVLSEIERLTKKPISQLFDLISGTSTGGIIALGVTTPDKNGKPKYTSQNVIEMYENKSKDIFSRSFFHKIKALGNILDQKYSSKGTMETFQGFFDDTLLTDTLTPLLITAYDIKNRKPYFFKTTKALFDADRNFYLKDIARATSAAPAYFEPAYIYNLPKTRDYTFIDGGVFANDPSMCAYVEAKNLFPEQDIMIFSTGATWYRQSYAFNKAKNWGAIEWAIPLIDIFFAGQGDSADYQLKTLFPKDTSSHDAYFRITTPTGEGEDNNQFDDASSENIQRIKKITNNYLEENSRFIEDICKNLTS